MANANQVIVKGETILDLRSDTVTPETLQKGYTAHDKSGTKITGTLEASSSGAAKETWVLNSATDYPTIDQDGVMFNVDFTSNGLSFSSIVLSTNLRAQILYDSTRVKMFGNWASEAYRKLTFDTPPTGALLTWLQANGVKQPDDTAVQDTKALTITSNGTVSVTPDAPYDALKKVDVTVDVASVSTVTINCEGNDTQAFWLSPDGVFHAIDLSKGANTIIVPQYSPIGLHNVYGYPLTNLNNIVDSGADMMVKVGENANEFRYQIHYATAITASATQPTD